MYSLVLIYQTFGTKVCCWCCLYCSPGRSCECLFSISYPWFHLIHWQRWPCWTYFRLHFSFQTFKSVSAALVHAEIILAKPSVGQREMNLAGHGWSVNFSSCGFTLKRSCSFSEYELCVKALWMLRYRDLGKRILRNHWLVRHSFYMRFAVVLMWCARFCPQMSKYIVVLPWFFFSLIWTILFGIYASCLITWFFSPVVKLGWFLWLLSQPKNNSLYAVLCCVAVEK